MGPYIARRLLLAAPVLLGVSLIVFFAVRLAPGDTALALAGLDANQQILDAIRHEYGLDRPWPEQYVFWLTNLLRGEPLPVPNSSRSDPQAELEEPIYLVLQAGQRISEQVMPNFR